MLIDITQVLLTATIVILTALLTVLGIEVFHILKDVRKLIDRVNNVLGDAEEVVQNVKKPTEVIASIGHSAELLTHLIGAVKHHETKKAEPTVTMPAPMIVEEIHTDTIPIETATPPAVQKPQEPAQPEMPVQVPQVRRFFRVPRNRAS